jgi:hypothetical protein
LVIAEALFEMAVLLTVIEEALFEMAFLLIVMAEAALALWLTATGPRAEGRALLDAIALGAIALSASVATEINIATLLFMVCSSFVFCFVRLSPPLVRRIRRVMGRVCVNCLPRTMHWR